MLREQKWVDMDARYRYGYQGKYAERDEETGWNHFQLREYDNIIGRWTSKDPKGQYYSPYVGMGNNPVNGTDPDGGKFLTDFINSKTGETKHVNDGIDQVLIVTPEQFTRIVPASWTSNLDDFNAYLAISSAGESVRMNSDLGKLARVVFAEARGENQASKEAVADIIRNRVLSNRYPNTYTGVITQRYAFSSLLQGDSNRPYYDNPYGYTTNQANQRAWSNSLTAAYKAYHNMSGIAKGSLLYYSPRSMLPANSMPGWNFDQLNEIFIDGIEPCRFSFYKYR